MSKELMEFERKLEGLIGRPTALRPFICEGSPIDCAVFIVGENPATPLSKGWWYYWTSDYGFRKSKWMLDYILERERRPLKPGKKRRQKVSPSRRTINWVATAAAPARCLETNIAVEEAESPKDLLGLDASLAVLGFLLQEVHPLVVVAHGDKAIAHLAELTQCNIRWGHEKDVYYRGHGFRLVATAHFGRPRAGEAWSQARSTALGVHIGRLAANSPDVAT